MLHSLNRTYAVLDPWFGRPPRPIELDMGCGFGRFTLELAARYPERLVLGSDINSVRLRRIVQRAGRRKLDNLEALHVSNLALVAWMLPDACVRRVHLLCPDPWPKTRHRGRRLVTTDFLTRVARVLEPDGVLHMSTDHPPYIETLREVAGGIPCLAPDPGAIADVADLETNFERLWRGKGKDVPHVAYRKRPPAPGNQG